LLRGYQAWWIAVGASEARVFSLEIESAAHLAWNIDRGEMSVTRWSPALGLRSETRRY